MLRTAVSFLTIAMLEVGILTASQLPQASAPPSDPADQYRASLNRYCITCHNAKLKTAGLTLDKVDVSNVVSDTPTWEKVIRKLRSNAMPPPGAPKPDKEFYESFPAYLEATIDRNAKLNPGRPAVHRLNRAEYSNAIRDLLAVEIPPETILPADDTGYGFDNIGDVLSVSPTLLEKYLAAARKISRLAIGDPKLSPTSTEYQIPADTVQTERENLDLPIGSRGGIAVRHHFPLDAEYVIKVRLQRGKDATNILGMNQAHQLDIRLDGKKIKSFTVGGQARRGGGGDDEGAADNSGLDDALEVRFFTTAGPHLVGVTFVKDTVKLEGFPASDRAQAFFEGVGNVSIAGPYNTKGSGDTPTRRNIFVCRPARREEEDPCAAKILTNLARRAYRRPIRNDEITALMAPYNIARDEGGF